MTNVGEDAEKGNPHALLVKSKLVQPLWKTMQISQKLKIELPYNPAIPLWDIYPKKIKTLT